MAASSARGRARACVFSAPNLHAVAEMHDTTEEYLETILSIEEEGIVPMRARLVERLGLSAAAVSETVARLAGQGYVSMANDRSLHLTDKGRGLATTVVRRHRLAERLLVDVIGLEWEKVHAEAARWEHSFVPDASGTGTTLYAVRPGARFRPRFGPRSAEQHRAAGAVELSLPGLTSLRRDVDQPRDLSAASDLGVGPHTAAVAARLG